MNKLKLGKCESELRITKVSVPYHNRVLRSESLIIAQRTYNLLFVEIEAIEED